MDAVRCLVEHGANPAAEDHSGRTALHLATVKSQPHMLEVLVRLGAPLAAQDSQGCTALHLAASGGHDQCLQALLQLGADVSAATPKRGGGGLLALALAGDAAAVRHALHAGADVNQRDAHGRTALHWAAATGLTVVLAALVEVRAPT